MYENIIVEQDGPVGVVRLNRPDVGNALSVTMLREFSHACGTLDADDSVRAIVVTGEGRMFSAGTDLSNPKATWSKQNDWDDHGDVDLRKLATPVLAAVNGPAVGAGLSIAVAADIRVVADDAKLGFVFVRRGIIADADLHWWLPRLVGTSKALELLITGRIFTGAEALDMGLALRAVPKDDVLETTLAIARDIAENCAPLSVAVTKSLTYRMLAETDPARAHDVEWDAFTRMGTMADAAEGPSAFMERRPPNWATSKSVAASFGAASPTA